MDGGVDHDGGWTVVRGKGKGRQKGTSLKRARDECCPGDAAGACTGPSAAAVDGGVGADGGLYAWSAGPQSKQRGRGGSGSGRGAIRERSAGEQCDQLLASIRSCRQEVASSAFFARLLAVLADAAEAHLDHLPYDGGAAAGAANAAPDGVAVPGDNGDSAANREAGVASRDGVDMGEASPAMAPITGAAAADADVSKGGGDGGGLLARWGSMRGLVVYGLGSPHLSRVSRYQLALVLLLRDRVLRGLTSAVQMYDPAFDEVDRLAFEQLGLQVTEVNEGGARRVSEPTFFYMPHCEGVLYDALLRANWSRTGHCQSQPDGGGESGPAGGGGSENGRLQLLAVLGNSFREYLERWEMRRAGSRSAGGPKAGQRRQPAEAAGPVVRCCLAGAVSELSTPELRFAVPSAFNAMALHLFPPSEALTRLMDEGEQEGQGEQGAVAAAGGPEEQMAAAMDGG